MRQDGYLLFPHQSGGILRGTSPQVSESRYFQLNGPSTTVGNTLTETRLWENQETLASYQVRQATIIRFAGTVVYSTTGTPTLTFRVRAGTTQPLPADEIARVVVSCRNNAASESIYVDLSVLYNGVFYSCFGGLASVQSVTTISSPAQILSVAPTQSPTYIALTAQWGTADPADTLTTAAAIMSLNYANFSGCFLQ